ncbi:MAG: bifunctional (p)ppGpp synthetase/guanosine-3',5'-bis(diphosphate) 3'-pyrophosphohydrolase [Alphaproteobacteria bacterium]|nr:bifunctional (p)ppGpp synthetase/guanosine-3',5'-bis(diphosphate) 3'-pyrophosphohydrolase [Alphaproteobacteria bacterium]
MEQDKAFTKKLYQALSFAVNHHGKVYQVRKSTNIPYIIHPVGVMEILLEYTDDVEIIQAGILHDILEDTEGTEQEIEQAFGVRVKNLVVGASEPNHDTLDWQSRKEHTISEVSKSADFDTLLVICADKLHNFKTIISDYEKMGEKVWQKFHQGKEKQLWYYSQMAKAILNRYPENKLFQEFYQTVENFKKSL